MKYVLAIGLICLASMGLRAADGPILISAKINGTPVQFAFDNVNGAPLVLFASAAGKLGLKINPPTSQVAPGEAALGTTEPCRLDLGATNFATVPALLEVPPPKYAAIDGIISWPALSIQVFSIDALENRLILLTNLPPETAAWQKFPIWGKSGSLGMDLSGPKGPKLPVIVDAGASTGARMGDAGWRLWKMAHLQDMETLYAAYSPGDGLIVSQETWAPKLALGSLELSEVPLIEPNRKLSASEPDCGAWLGRAALKRLNLVVDGPHGVVYAQPVSAPATPYEHNRLGAIFVPRDLEGTSPDLVAHVMIDTPGQVAGIRNGDVLLKIDDLDVTQWRTDPSILPLSRFWSRPAGTAMDLTLQRREKTFKITVRLRNILPPETARRGR